MQQFPPYQFIYPCSVLYLFQFNREKHKQSKHMSCDVHMIINETISAATALQGNFCTDSQGNLHSVLPFE